MSALASRTHHAVGSIVLASLLCALAGCGRQPLAPIQPRARAGSPTLSIPAPDTSARERPGVVARLAPSASAADIAASYGCDVLGFLPEIRIGLFRARVDMTNDAFTAHLAGDPRIEFYEPDLEFRTSESRQFTIAFSEGDRAWPDVADQLALVRVGAPEAHALARGAGVLVAILDTGIQLDHPALATQLDLPGVELGTPIAPGDDRAEHVDTNGDGLIDGALGHGTHVAGIVHALAPDARLLPVRVLDSDGVGHAFALANGIVTAIRRGALVLNMSLGMSGVSRSVAAAIDFAEASGAVVVAPSGNAGQESVDFPAADAPVVAVAGTDAYDQKAVFSNYGPAVDVAAPATGILSTYVGSGYALWSGTSMAAPFASGVAALLYGSAGSRNASTAANVAEALGRGALPLGALDPAFGWALGAGRVSASRSLGEFLSLQARRSEPIPDDRELRR